MISLFSQYSRISHLFAHKVSITFVRFSLVSHVLMNNGDANVRTCES